MGILGVRKRERRRWTRSSMAALRQAEGCRCSALAPLRGLGLLITSAFFAAPGRFRRLRFRLSPIVQDAAGSALPILHNLS